MLPRSYADFPALDFKDLYKAKGGQGEELDPRFVDGEKESYRSKMSSQVHREGLLYLIEPRPCSCAPALAVLLLAEMYFFKALEESKLFKSL